MTANVPTGKGATLEHIRSRLPRVPIPPFVRVPVTLDAKPTLLDRLGLSSIPLQEREELRLAREIGYPLIVRSDAKYEDGLGKSFAGLFESVPVFSPEQLPQAVRQVRRSSSCELSSDEAFRYQVDRRRWARTQLYGDSRDVDVEEGPIDVIFQKYLPGICRALLTEHPALPGSLFLDLESQPQSHQPMRTGYLFHNAVDVKNAFGDCNLAENILDLMRCYWRVRDLFPSDVVYQAEMILAPNALVQWRPFRPARQADFALDDVIPPSSETVDVAIPLDATGAEGVVCAPGQWYVNYHLTNSGTRAELESLLPKASFFMTEDRYSGPDGLPYICAPWQSHDCFRFLERDSHVAFVNDIPGSWPFRNKTIRYWSDGRRGRIAPAR